MAPGPSRPLFSYENLVHALAGSAGAVTAMTTFYPFDTVRAILQVDDKRKAKNSLAMLAELTREDGFFSLYKGLLPVLSAVCVSNFVYFFTLKALHAKVKNRDALKDLVLASIAGVVNVLTTTPIWVVVTRLKLQGTTFHSEEMKENYQKSYNGIIDGLLKIGKDEGVAGLWGSTVPSLILVCNPSIHFTVYEILKRRLQHAYGLKELSAISYFLMGAVAKAVATVLTYPIQVIQARFRFEKKTQGKQMSLHEMMLHIHRTQGVKGLYKGLEAKMIQTVFTAALMFVCYEKIAALVFKLLK